jgi:parallel beta-helix repeat protein
VATNGNNQWTGQLPAPNPAKTDGPFATLQRARDQLRVMRLAAPLTNGASVYVRGGTYYLASTFELDVQDAGLSNAPIVYQAYPNETPRLNGSRPITNFVAWRGPILQANVAAQGFTNAFRQLFFNAHRQQLARYPNYVDSDPYGSGWAYVDGPLTNMYLDLPNDSSNSFKYKPGDVRFWARPQEVEVFIFPRYNWYNNIIPVSQVDTSQRVITLAGNTAYAIRPGDRYFVRNAFEELDAPGEYYLDNQFKVLYFWPPCGTANPVAYAPAFETHLVLLNSANITLQGFTLECADETAIGLHGCTNCSIFGCTLRNVLGYGIGVFGSYGSAVIGNDIYSVGDEGIHIEGGVQATLTPGGNLAENNYLHHVGVFDKGAAAISIAAGVGNLARYNLIHDCPRTGIVVRGNLCGAEYNRIYHVNLETDDTGGIFTSGPDWITSRGNSIRYNYVSDSLGYGFFSGQYGTPHYGWGIYLDTDAAAVDVVGNVLEYCSRGGIHLHNGRDNLIVNNVLANNVDNQLTYYGWTSTTPEWQQYLPEMIVAYNSVSADPAWQNLRGMNVSPTDAVLPDGLIMAYNQFSLNIVAFTNGTANVYGLNYVPVYANPWSWNLLYGYGGALHLNIDGQQVSFSDWQTMGWDPGTRVADPLFVDFAAGDYRLQPDSPALAMGFSQIPMDQIGLYSSPLRATWPVTPSLAGGPLQLQILGTDVAIRLQSSVDHGYQLQRADSLNSAVWQNIGAPQDGTGDVLSFLDVSGATAPAHFYRFQTCP